MVDLRVLNECAERNVDFCLLVREHHVLDEERTLDQLVEEDAGLSKHEAVVQLEEHEYICQVSHA
jgi:hypothetical protein